MEPQNESNPFMLQKTKPVPKINGEPLKYNFTNTLPYIFLGYFPVYTLLPLSWESLVKRALAYNTMYTYCIKIK